MDFQLSDGQRELRDAARKFARAEMPDVAAHCEQTGEPVEHDMLKKLGDMGSVSYTHLTLPTKA